MLSENTGLVGRQCRKSGFGATLALHYDFTKSSLGSVSVVGPALAYTPRGSTAWMWNSSGVLVEVASETPRLAAHRYDGAAWVNRGWCGGVARTNSLLQSRNYNTTWTNVGTPTAVQDQTGSDGVANTAWTLGDDSISEREAKRQGVGIADNSDTHCASFRVKKDNDETRFPMLRLLLRGGTVEQVAQITLNTKTGASYEDFAVGMVDHGVIDEGDWWLLWVTVANNSTGNTQARIEIYPAFALTLTGGSDATVTGSVVLDHSQLELDTSEPSDTIPTTTVAATRAAERPDNLTDLSWFDEDKGTFLAEGYFMTLENGGIFTLCDVLINGADYHQVIEQSDLLRYAVQDGDVNVIGENSDAAYTLHASYKMAAAFEAGGTAELVIDGAAQGTPSTPASLPSASDLNLLRFGYGTDINIGWPVFHITTFKFWAERKSQADMEALTA